LSNWFGLSALKAGWLCSDEGMTRNRFVNNLKWPAKYYANDVKGGAQTCKSIAKSPLGTAKTHRSYAESHKSATKSGKSALWLNKVRAIFKVLLR